jgi:hypothetical protein
MADHYGGTLKKLVSETNVANSTFPPTLAETGLFQDLRSLTPAPGVVPYSINVPFWSDGAEKARWFAARTMNSFIEFSPTEQWDFPVGTTWVKHFDIELVKGAPIT